MKPDCILSCRAFARIVSLLPVSAWLFAAGAYAETVTIAAPAGAATNALALVTGADALAVNPETPAEKTLPYLKELDGILVMTVHPGYGGQSFISECLPKISFIRAAAPGLDIMIDGGGNGQTIPLSAKAGANQFVAGSFLYRAPDMKAAVEDLRERLK